MIRSCRINWIFLVVLVIGSFQITQTLFPCVDNDRKCILFTQCRSALELLKTRQVELLRKMFCGFDEGSPKVCCRPGSEIVFPNDTENVTNRLKNTTTPKITTTTVEKLNTVSVPHTTLQNVNRYNLPSRKICGFSGYGIDRIVGGNIAAIDEFPWLVQIKTKTKSRKQEKYTCAGSLITDKYVLTAAHCLLNKIAVSVRLGEWDTETEHDCEESNCSDPPLDIDINDTIIHPLYDMRTFNSDIALLRLKNVVNFTEFIRPVCLPNTKYAMKQDYVNGTVFWTAGWGKTEFGEPSIIKRKVDLDAVPIDVCIEKLPVVKRLNTQNVICAGGNIGKDTCNGDSGGSLVKEVTEDFHTNWFLYGITSLGSADCGGDIPAVYTRIVSYMDWIIQNIRNLADSLSRP
ncbi:unnamed protein product [Parnassius apollo]|uniref:(apollo) hypothetical protein n=1 Tax=Parnassius apollo TaxID=110799 RepID=A0A8S3WDN2_PARAO|nr:unnamed protein product [Parnassius apollo]